MTIRTVRLPLALLVEVLWSFAAAAVFVQVFGQDDGPAPSFVTVAAVVLGAFVVARALQETELDDLQLRAAGVAVSVVALFAIIHTEYAASSGPWEFGWLRTLIEHPDVYTQNDAHALAGAAALIVLWLRSVGRGQQAEDFDDVLASVALGLIPVAIAAGSAPDVHGPGVFPAIALAYLVLGLCVLALYQTPDEDAPVAPFAARWSTAFAGLLGIALALTVVAAAIDPDAFGVLAPLGNPLLVGSEFVIRYIIAPPFALIGWLVQLILPDSDRPQPDPNLPDPPPVEEQDEDEREPWWVRVLRWTLAGGVVTLVVMVVLLAMWLVFRRFARRKPRHHERRERLEPGTTLREDLGELLAGIGRRFRRPAPQPRSAVAIRRLYHEMLENAAARGLARPPAATPMEFAPPLDAHYASPTPSAVTDAFVASRYGQQDPADAAIAELRARWRDARERP